MIMKNLTLIMLASAVIFATSCLGSGVSKSDYTIVGNFDGYASSDQLVAQYFKDSLRFAKQILTDEFLLTMKIIPFSMADSAYR